MCGRTSRVILLAIVLVSSASPAFAQNLSIQHIDFWWHGAPAEVAVTSDGISRDLSAFDLLIAIDDEYMNVINVAEGTALQQSAWEYFSYTRLLDTLGLYPLGDASSMLHIQALRGDGLPFADPAGTNELARLRILPAYTPETECMGAPLRFFWRDCRDNVLYVGAGDTALTVDTVIDYTWPPLNPYLPPLEPVGYSSPTECAEYPAPVTERSLTANNGIIDFICSDSLGRWVGDINLDGQYMTMADVVLYERYFYGGIPILPWPIEASVAQSDINLDGMPLTVADFVLLLRYVSGDLYIGDIPKPTVPAAPVAITVSRDLTGVTYEITSAADIAAAWLRFGTDAPITINGSNAQHGLFDNKRSILLADIENLTPAVAAGECLSIRIEDPNARLNHVEAADPFARNLKIEESGTLPASFMLHQNYPNPFNPTTTIAFSLLIESDWTLDVLNITGQIVEGRSGHGMGDISIEWNAAAYSSGVYLYRLKAGVLEQTRRMVLLK